MRKAFYTEPPEVGGQLVGVNLKASNFGKAHSSHPSQRNKPRRYLLLGFDTEFQTPDPRVRLDEPVVKVTSVGENEGYLADKRDFKFEKEQGFLRNEILSYQFHGYVLDPDHPDDGESWSGVVLPFKADKETDGRLSVQEFVLHALSEGVKEFPNMKIPREIYFIAHFTRADIPAFTEFRQNDSDVKLALSNIRNTFVTIDKDIQIPLDLSDGEFELKLKLRDTITLAPALRKSLLEVGKMLGYEKIQLAEDEAQERSIKENMKTFKRDHWEKFREYGIRDAEVCVKYAKELIEINWQETGRYIMPATLTAMAVNLLKKKWQDRNWNPLKVVGKTREKDLSFNKKEMRSESRFKNVYLDKLFWRIDFATESYHGGRNEQFWFGPCFEDDWYDWDLRSAYATTMSLIGYPDWQRLKEINSTEELLSYQIDDLAFASVNFKFPDATRYPCLPVRTMYGLVFPLEGTSLCGIPEIKLAEKLGATIEFNVGVYIPTNKNIRVFEDFIVYCINERKKHAKGTLYEQFWKEMSNSTYGKTAQGLRERRVYDLKASDTKRLEESDVTNPFFASFITSFVRATLGEIMNKLPKKTCIFSVTTDGFLTNADEAAIKRAQAGPLCNAMLKAESD